MKHFIYLFLLSISISLTAQIPTSAKEKAKVKKELISEVNQILETLNVPAASVSVVLKDGVLLTEGFGKLDNQKEKADEESLFMIGSCSKAFTSTLLGIVQKNEDDFSFDDPITEILPSLKFHPDILSEQIRLKDALSHVTGLPRHDFSWYLFGGTSDELLKRVEFQAANKQVREQWQYNNFMYLAAGKIAEQHFNTTWGKAIQEQLFNPLEMNGSTTELEVLLASPNRAKPFNTYFDKEAQKWKQKEVPYHIIGGMAAAGSISSNAKDMAKWLNVWLKKLEPLGLTSYYMSALTPYVSLQKLPTQTHPDVFGAGYGYGWFTNSYRGHFRVEHGGNIDGFSSLTLFLPTDNIGIFVSVNQNGSAAPTVIANMISDKLLGLEEYNWAAEASTARMGALADLTVEEFETITVDHSEFLGSYTHPGYGTFEMLERNDSLFAKFPKYEYLVQFKYPHVAYLYEYSENAGKFEADTKFPLSFDRNTDNQVQSVEIPIELSLEPIEFKRTSNEAKNINFKAFTGSFQLGPQSISVKEADTKGSLILSITGQPDYTLIFQEGSSFNLKGLTGYSVEFKNLDTAKQKFNELNFYQPNGNFTAKRKE